jgi:2-iminoacetate synthase
MAPLGVTMMSAGSHTEPGGYTGQGANQIQRTARGRKVEGAIPASACGSTQATEQFSISDDRSPAEVAAMLRSKGLEPVWKDWDAAILKNDEGKMKNEKTGTSIAVPIPA